MPETNTEQTHTPINLAPGVDLMVRADLADDDDTAQLVEKCKELFDRAAHVERITEIVERLRQIDTPAVFCGLGEILNIMGWTSIYTESTVDRLADGVLALLAIAPLADVIDALSVAEHVNHHVRAWERPEAQS